MLKTACERVKCAKHTNDRTFICEANKQRTDNIFIYFFFPLLYILKCTILFLCLLVLAWL